jgi:hypothetical protein
MEGREKPHKDKYKDITDDRKYEASCTLISLPVWDRTFETLYFCCTECIYSLSHLIYGKSLKVYASPNKLKLAVYC